MRATTTAKPRRVQSAAEAHGLHETWRAWLLALARYHAVSHALLHTTVHTRIVRSILCDESILPVAGVGAGAAVERWLGSVFKKGPWAWTGDMHAVTSSATNIHSGQSVKVWKLTTTDTDELAPWLVRPEEPDGARDRVLALYAPPSRSATPPTGLTTPSGALAWPAGLDAVRVADEVRLARRRELLLGERPPFGFEDLERILREFAAAHAAPNGDGQKREGAP